MPVSLTLLTLEMLTTSTHLESIVRHPHLAQFAEIGKKYTCEFSSNGDSIGIGLSFDEESN